MATEKRLIDASEIPELLEKEFARKWRLILDGETHLDNLAEGFFGAKNVIWAMPTVDAVEVVRCKDCKHCERDHTLDAGGDEYYYCWHVVMEHGQARPNEFCCYGERRSDGK